MTSETNGKYVYRKARFWYYRFMVAGRKFHGPTHTADKQEAEAIADRYRASARAAGRRNRGWLPQRKYAVTDLAAFLNQAVKDLRRAWVVR